MRKAIQASALVLLLACSAQAGWIQNGSPEPSPTPTPVPNNMTVWAENGSPAPEPVYSDQASAMSGHARNDASAALAEAALVLLNSVLALL